MGISAIWSWFDALTIGLVNVISWLTTPFTQRLWVLEAQIANYQEMGYVSTGEWRYTNFFFSKEYEMLGPGGLPPIAIIGVGAVLSLVLWKCIKELIK